MFAVRHRTFHFGLMLATALSVSMLANAARAYTQEQEQACTGDAFRVCSSEIPDVDRVTACMVRNQSQLSPGCRAYFRAPQPESPRAVTRPSGQPLSIRPVTARKPVKPVKPRKPKKPAKPASTG